MKQDEFEIELDGRRVLVNRGSQEIRIVDADGNTLAREPIQVAAGSVQGIFSSLHDATGGIAGTPTRRNA